MALFYHRFIIFVGKVFSVAGAVFGIHFQGKSGIIIPTNFFY